MAAAAARVRKTVEGRVDPKPRLIDNVLPWQRLKNKDERRHYVLVNERMNGEFDVSYYEALAEGLGLPREDGYVVEVRKPGGVTLAAGVTAEEGQPIRFRGMILMSCPKAFKKLLEDFGDDGQSGQEGANERDRLYKKNKGTYESLADVRGRGISVHTKNELEGLPPEEE
jgi:hypothetical protein